MKQKISLKKWVKLLAICCMLCFLGTMQVKAEEVTNVGIVFQVTDETTNGYYGDITVSFTNKDTGEVYDVILTRDKVWGPEEIYSEMLPAKVRLDASVTYSEENVKLVDTDGGEITWYKFPTYGSLLNWKIVDAENVVVEEQEETVATEKSTTIETENSVTSVKIGNAEADEVFNTFLEKVKVIEGNDAYQRLNHHYDMVLNVHTQNYEEYTKNSAETYMNMTAFERMLVYETYVYVQNILSENTYTYHFATEEDFMINVAYSSNGYYLTKDVDKEVANAFLDIMRWQYHYAVENGCCYNFVEGKSYLEIGGDAKMQEEALQEEAEKNASQMQEIYDELTAAGMDVEQLDNDVVEAEKKIELNANQPVALSPSADTSTSSNNGFVIIIVTAIIVCGAVAIVAILKKKQN